MVILVTNTHTHTHDRATTLTFSRLSFLLWLGMRRCRLFGRLFATRSRGILLVTFPDDLDIRARVGFECDTAVVLVHTVIVSSSRQVRFTGSAAIGLLSGDAGLTWWDTRPITEGRIRLIATERKIIQDLKHCCCGHVLVKIEE